VTWCHPPEQHEVRLGTRQPDREDVQEFRPGLAAEVAADADPVVLAVPGDAAADVARSIAAEVAGKVLIDTTNSVDRSHGDLRLSVPAGDSLGERVQSAAHRRAW
jgi:predicted dinucleotide-binding enzyme